MQPIEQTLKALKQMNPSMDRDAAVNGKGECTRNSGNVGSSRNELLGNKTAAGRHGTRPCGVAPADTMVLLGRVAKSDLY